jgi:hypothetical protein
MVVVCFFIRKTGMNHGICEPIHINTGIPAVQTPISQQYSMSHFFRMDQKTMNRINQTLSCLPLLASAALAPGVLFAASENFVESMQMPAWYERDGVTYALRPGDELKSGDLIRTGPAARALLRMAEGSIVKLGADASFDITQVSDDPQPSNVFQALLKVVRGAFRFTTTELGKSRARSVDVEIGHVTVGIRGTDIWGRSRPGEDLFALLEGKVTVQRDNEQPFTMEEPLTFIVAEQGKATTPIQKADMATVNTLAQETELQTGDGVLSVDGQWSVNLMSLLDSNAAEKLIAQLHEAGYGAERKLIEINAQSWTRIRIDGFVSKADAEAFADGISNRYGITQPWILQND